MDLRAQHDSIRQELDAAIRYVIDTSAFIQGPAVKEFEGAWADYLAVKHGVGVSSGTAALHLSLRALGIGPGDEVITTAFTFIATIEAILYAGAKPILVDVDSATMLINERLIEEKISSRTKAIIPVHLYGHPARMDRILEIAKKRNLFVVEDAAQAHGAKFKGKACGTMGEIGCFSFYPGKNLGALGDAGGIVTSSDMLNEKLLMIRDHGRKSKYEHLELGWGDRLDTLQAAVLRVKLRYLDAWTEKRRQHAAFYQQALASTDLELPVEQSDCRHVYHIFAVRTPQRDALLAHLKADGIQAGLHYPLAIHEQPIMKNLGYAEETFQESERIAREEISLPLFPEMKETDLTRVVDSILKFFAR